MIFLASIKIVAQVGINTADPQQTLHVAGANAIDNVRVGGLNSPNNTNNLGSDYTTRVLVNANGDLVLGTTSEQPFELLVDAENYIQDGLNSGNSIIQTGNGSGFREAGTPNDIPGAVFTLTKNAIVEVNYSISWTILKNSQRRLSDKDARIVQTALYFRKGTRAELEANPYGGTYYPGTPPNIRILTALSGQFYANGDPADPNNEQGNYGAYQNFQNTGTDYVELPAGTYVALFVGQVAVSSAAATGAVECYLGAGPEDNLQILAYYYE